MGSFYFFSLAVAKIQEEIADSISICSPCFYSIQSIPLYSQCPLNLKKYNPTTSLPSLLSHLVPTWILTTWSQSSTSCYSREIFGRKGKGEVIWAQETATRKYALKFLPKRWCLPVYALICFWNRKKLGNDPFLPCGRSRGRSVEEWIAWRGKERKEEKNLTK